MATTLMSPAASAENTPAAMPGVPCMPRPTTATVAMPGLTSTPSISPRPISPLELLRAGCRAPSAASGSGTLKQIECSDEAWEISETEIRLACRAAKVRAAMPGTPSMPLPVTVTSAWPAGADSALTGKRPGVDPLRDLGAGRVGIGERTHEDRDPPAGQRNQGARVQHLGAVVGQLRRLAGVELRDDARVGDHARIGGQQPGTSFQSVTRARAERAGEQGGGEVGPAAAERGDLAGRASRR